MTHGTVNMLNLHHEITIMIINAGQKRLVSYSDRMCNLNCPELRINDELNQTTKKKHYLKKLDIIKKKKRFLFYLVIYNVSPVALFNQITVGLLVSSFFS